MLNQYDEDEEEERVEEEEEREEKEQVPTHRNVFTRRPKAHRSSRGRHTWKLLLPRVALDRMRRNGYRDDSLLDDDSDYWLESDSEESDSSLMKMNLVRPETLAREIPHVMSRLTVDVQEELPHVLNQWGKDAITLQSQVVKAIDRASPTRDIQDMFDIEKVGPAGCIDVLDEFFGCSRTGPCAPMDRRCLPETDCDAIPNPLEMRIIRSDMDENSGNEDDDSSIGFSIFTPKKKKPAMRPKQRAHSLQPRRKPSALSANGLPETRVFYSPIDDDTDEESLKMVRKAPRELPASTSTPDYVADVVSVVSTADKADSSPTCEELIITDESTIVVHVEISEEKDCVGDNEEDRRSESLKSRFSRVYSMFDMRSSRSKQHSFRGAGPVDVDLVTESWDSEDRSGQLRVSNVGSNRSTIFSAAS